MNKSALSVLALAILCATVFLIYMHYEKKGHEEEMKSQQILPEKKFTSEQIMDFYRQRRSRYLEQAKDGILILSNNSKSEENFFYLTGFDEPDAFCVLIPGSGKPFRMFVMPDNPVIRLWTGKYYGLDGTRKLFGADEVYPADQLSAFLAELLKNWKKVYLDPTDSRSKDVIDETSKAKIEIASPVAIIEEMRVLKDDYEIDQLRKAIDVTCDAYIRAVKTTHPNLFEYEIQAEIEYIFTRNGMKLGYSSIIGSGPNAAILHYEKNNRRMKDGELLLMDVGAASNHYSADVTRTIPVSGKFSLEQKELYNLILMAQEAGIREMVPGKMILDCHHAATRIIVEGLYKMGLITDTSKYWQKRFYIQYRNDHYIGLDVHDAGSYGNFNAAARDDYIINESIRGRKLEPGMVLTMEPGIYMASERIDQLKEIFPDTPQEEINTFVRKVKPVYMKYADIGIRIEDDILITKDGNLVLSARAPKVPEDIEKLMK